MMKIVCKPVDYNDKEQGKLLVQLLNGYALDPLGGGSPLSDEVKEQLPLRLAQRAPQAFSFIAFADDGGSDKETSATPAGIINCFDGFSTFAAQPLVNVHDLFVAPKFRGKGIGRALLGAAETEAIRRGCCKLTLEVLSKNEAAIKAYQKSGYRSYELDPANGVALFMEKKLT